MRSRFCVFPIHTNSHLLLNVGFRVGGQFSLQATLLLTSAASDFLWKRRSCVELGVAGSYTVRYDPPTVFIF